MLKLIDKIVQKSGGRLTYHLISYFIMVLVISVLFLFLFVL